GLDRGRKRARRTRPGALRARLLLGAARLGAHRHRRGRARREGGRGARDGQGLQDAHRAGGPRGAPGDRGVAPRARHDREGRRERDVRGPHGKTRRAARGAAAHQALGGARRNRGRRASAHAAPFVRLARAAVLGRPARGAGDARPREHRLHPGLHAPRLPAPRQGVRRGASAGATPQGLSRARKRPARGPAFERPCGGRHAGDRPHRRPRQRQDDAPQRDARRPALRGYGRARERMGRDRDRPRAGTLRERYFERASGAVPPFRRVVIETTGLADPAPLLATLIEMPAVATRYSLAGVVTTVDAEHGMATLDAHPEALKQAAMADRLVITKVDRADRATVAALEERLRGLNPGAALLAKGREAPDPALLLEAGLYRGEGRIADPRGWLNAGAYRRVGAPDAPRHDPRIVSFAWSGEEPFGIDDLETALETITGLLGARLLRLKGLANVRGETGPIAVHAVQHTLYPPARLSAWPDEDRRTRLVFIGRDLE